MRRSTAKSIVVGLLLAGVVSVGYVVDLDQAGAQESIEDLQKKIQESQKELEKIEASWQAVRFDPVLQEYYRSHYGKQPNKIIVKVARKLLSRIHAVIKTEIPYQIGVIK